MTTAKQAFSSCLLRDGDPEAWKAGVTCPRSRAVKSRET